MPTIPRKSERKSWQPDRKPFEGITGRTGFYSNAAWRRFRIVFLMAHPICLSCEASGTITRATEVHHVHAVNPDNPYDEQNGRFGPPLDEANCQALCKQCHDSITRKRRSK